MTALVGANGRTGPRRRGPVRPAAALGALAAAFVVTFAAAGLGSAFTTPALPGWYAALDKPSWNPPTWVFGPVWTLLYTLMAVAVWGVWRRRDQHRAANMTAYGLQLALNVGWSVAFFGLRSPGWALVVIALLWTAIAATIGSFARTSRFAAALLVPYLGWVSFASALNLAIWRLN